MVFPPTPQKASTIVSHWQRSAMCCAIFSGVTENQPSERRETRGFQYNLAKVHVTLKWAFCHFTPLENTIFSWLENILAQKVSKSTEFSPLSILTPSSYREKSRYLWNQYLCSSSSSSISLGIGIIFLRLFFPFFFFCVCFSWIAFVAVFSSVAVVTSILSGAQSTGGTTSNREMTKGCMYTKRLHFFATWDKLYHVHFEKKMQKSVIFLGEGQLLKWVCQPIFFGENCMKMKEFGPLGARPWRPP